MCTETIGGFVRTQLVPIRCQFGIDLTSSKHCQPCDSSKVKRMQLISKDGKAIPHLGGTGKNPGGILFMSITTKMDPALIDQENLLKRDWDTYSRSHTSHSMAQVLSAFTIIFIPSWAHLFDSFLLFLLLPHPPVCPRLPLPPRAVP